MCQAYFKNEAELVIPWGFEEKSQKCEPSGNGHRRGAALEGRQLLRVVFQSLEASRRVLGPLCLAGF